MSELAKEAADLIDRLPPDEAEAVLKALRLLVEQEAEGDARWEELLASPAHRAGFERYLEEVRREIAEGKIEPLDPGKL